MHPVLTPPPMQPKRLSTPLAAVERLIANLRAQHSLSARSLRGLCEWRAVSTRVRAAYPFVRIMTSTYARLDSRLSLRVRPGPGIYDTTVTRPDLFRAYLTEQIGLLIENQGVPVEVAS